MQTVTRVIDTINDQIINPLIALLFALALLLFLWGSFEFIAHATTEEGRETGKRHMIWGIGGMFIMISVFGIIKLLLNTFGISYSNLPL